MMLPSVRCVTCCQFNLTDVAISQIELAAGDTSEDFLFEVTATYQPLNYGGQSTPVVDKATWSVSFRPQQITITNVEQDSEQTHYEPGSGGEEHLAGE